MNYVTKVADQFLKLHPEAPILDPADYLIIAEWEKQEIPLSLVLTVINEGCADCKKETLKIESIDYFQAAVQKNYLYWLQTQTTEF